MNKTSLKKLATAHEDLQKLAHAVDEVYPIQVICGVRGEKEQDQALLEGKSRLRFPLSKHNLNPSEGRLTSYAIDCVPDPDKNPATLDWRDTKAFLRMCEVFEQKAVELGISIRLGGDFRFVDLPHIELR